MLKTEFIGLAGDLVRDQLLISRGNRHQYMQKNNKKEKLQLKLGALCLLRSHIVNSQKKPQPFSISIHQGQMSDMIKTDERRTLGL